MGNSPITVGLKINAPSKGLIGSEIQHVAGSIVYGTIYLSLNRREDEAASIRLRVIGKENVVVHHTTNDDDRHNSSNHERRQNSSSHSSVRRDHYEQSSHDIWKVDHDLKRFQNGIPKGQYEFPFALQLPDSLPSTMSSNCGQSTCEVRYEIVAEVYKHPNSIIYSNPCAKEEIRVVAKSLVTPEHDTSLQLPLDIISINKCCCFSCTSQGTIALETKFDKTTMLVDQSVTSCHQGNGIDHTPNTVTVEFRCQNKSKAKVGSVDVQIIEIIEWTSNGYQETIKTILVEAKKDARLYPELDALLRTPNRFEQRRDDSEAHTLLEYNPWHAIGPLLVPSHANDSYRGTSIQVRHVLNVQLKTLGCCATNPDVSSIIEIYRNPILTGTSSAKSAATTESMGKHQISPTAPFEDDFSSTNMSQQASAPSDIYDYEYRHDNQVGYNNNEKIYRNENDLTSIPTAEARLVLPDDWNAETADLVNIPMAEVTLMSENSNISRLERPTKNNF